jgi:hypothetical protein
VVLEFSGGEKVLYDCNVQLEPTALKFSETHLYVTQTRLVFELEEPLSVELSEVMELSLENSYGERFIYIKYKDLSGVNSLIFVCTGFGGIISNISKTIFVYKLINKLREGMHPRDIRFIMSGSAVELYAPWVLLTVMLISPAVSLMLPIGCWGRLALGLTFLLAFTVFSFTEVYKLLLGRLRWSVYLIVCLIISVSLLFIWNGCSTVEVMHPAVIYGKEIQGDLKNPKSVWYCLKVRSDVGEGSLCVARDDWTTFDVGDRVMVYYMEGPISSYIVPHKYDDRSPEYVVKNRLG